MKNKLIAIIVAVLIAGGGTGAYLYLTRDTSPTTETAATEQQTAETTGSISYSDDGTTVTYTGETGKTALANLQALTTVETESSSYGDYVTGINGVMAETNKSYWALYVNDEYANEGAGTYVTKEGDTFKWVLEEIQQ